MKGWALLLSFVIITPIIYYNRTRQRNKNSMTTEALKLRQQSNEFKPWIILQILPTAAFLFLLQD